MNTEKEEISFFDRIETFMFTRRFIFLATLTITLPLTVNVYALYLRISPVWQDGFIFKHVYAFSYACAVALGVLVFTFHYIKRKPLIFAIFISTIDLLFFDPFDPSKSHLTRITILLVCVFGGYIKYSYAGLYAKKAAESRKKTVNGNVFTAVNKAENTDEINGDEYTCQECGKPFNSVKALNGHMVAHRSKSA